jgi:hypothetical protein
MVRRSAVGYTGTAKTLPWPIVGLLIAQFTFAWTMPHIGRNTPIYTSPSALLSWRSLWSACCGGWDTASQSQIRSQACVIKSLTPKCEHACILAMLGSAIEHQHGVVFRMGAKHREHRSLRPVRKVEVAVPGKDTVEATVERQTTHVGDDPFLLWQPSMRQGDHFGRRV